MASLSDRFRKYREGRRQRRQKRRAAAAAGTDANLDKRLVLGVSGKRLPSAGQMKYIGRYLSKKERAALWTLVGVVCMSGIALAYKYATDHIVEMPAVGGEYIEASIGSPRYVNPVLASANDADLDLVKLVFSGLVRTDEDGSIVPDLADTYTVSDDGLTYTFALRQDVIWHDGTVFAAADVVATMEYIKNPAWKSPYYSRFKNVTVEAPDQATVVFTLQEPFSPFLSMLTIGILPEHLWQAVKPENAALAELNVKPIGTGPYRFKTFTKDKNGAIKSYTLERYDAYYRNKANIETITFRYFPDLGSATDAVLARRVDGSSYLPLEYRPAVEESQALRIWTLRLPQYTALFFNTERNPILASKNVRKALATATDRIKVLQETLGDGGAPVHGPILPGFVGFHPDVKRYKFDLEAASQMLDDEGWTVDAETGFRTKDLPDPNDAKTKVATTLAVTITTVDGKENIAAAQLIKETWEGIGVKTELEIVPASRIQADAIRPRDYDALLYGEILGPDPDPYPFWHSSQTGENGLNLTKFTSRRVDELLEQGRQSTDDEKRAELYREFQDILADEAVTIFLYRPTYSYAMNRRIRGVREQTIFTPADRFSNVTDWYIDTQRVWQ